MTGAFRTCNCSTSAHVIHWWDPPFKFPVQTRRLASCRHWRFRMSRAWAAQHHKPGATNPYASSQRVEPAHRQQVLLDPHIIPFSLLRASDCAGLQPSSSDMRHSTV